MGQRQQVTAQYLSGIPSVSATYTPARGSAPAILTLNGATISNSISGSDGAGIYAEEPLEIRLKGSNTIDLRASSYADSVSGVFINGYALTITAEPDASLVSEIEAPNASGVDCYGIRADGNGGKITINGGDITAYGLADTGSGFGMKTDAGLTVNEGTVTAESEGDDASSFAVAADSLSLGTNLGIITPVNAIAPDDGAHYIRDHEGNAAKDVEIGRAYAVTYDANGGTGAMRPGTAAEGAAFPLPDCAFTAPRGYQFKAWAVGSGSGTKIAAGDTHTFTENTTVYAVWKDTSSDSDSEPDMTQYQITEGQSGVWTRGGTGGLRFTSDGSYGKFTGVRVDGSLISGDQYTVESDSVTITLKASYLSTLSEGQHTLRVNFTDGYAKTFFTIGNTGAKVNPTTGAQDCGSMAVAPAVMAAICGAAAALRKKED